MPFSPLSSQKKRMLGSSYFLDFPTVQVWNILKKNIPFAYWLYQARTFSENGIHSGKTITKHPLFNSS